MSTTLFTTHAAALSSTLAAPVASLPLASVRQIAIIGAGRMGRAIAEGVLGSGVFSAGALVLSDRMASVAATLAAELGAGAAPDNTTAVRGADVVVLCVKPKDVVPVLDDLMAGDALAHGPLLVSIAAGVSIASIEAAVRGAAPVVRAMPNTPCCIGEGATVLAAGRGATGGQLDVARAIFATVGRCLVLDERHFDAVTALSASGPAFVYVMLEALADGGVRCGLPRHVATELAAQMTLGAAAMVLRTGRHPASLKDDVTTPGGCTISGLLTLEDGRVRSVLARAIETTAQRAAELGA